MGIIKIDYKAFMDVLVDEVVRAGDVFLVKFECPYCKNDLMEGLPLKGNCSKCHNPLKSIILDMDKCTKRNIVAIDDQKRRKRITKTTVRKLMNLQNNCCAYCSKGLLTNPYHVDHITPICCGGTNEFNNLALSCPTCNLTASGKYFSNISTKIDYIQSKNKQKAR